MKRIVLTLAALAFSTSSVFAENIETYGSVLQDQVSPSSSYSNPETWLENHGSVLLDKVDRNRGIDSEIGVGNSISALFEADKELGF
ncbi:MAG: hypothetical protein GY753_09055 [Gammaproteobacteria bacterium]|nr:hypothetical protein [Gammaproteobacteria bacterium]